MWLVSSVASGWVGIHLLPSAIIKSRICPLTREGNQRKRRKERNFWDINFICLNIRRFSLVEML